MNIEPNNRVVCIDDSFAPHIASLFTALPVKDRVYVVRDVLIGHSPVDKRGHREGRVRLPLVGLVNPKADDGQEHGFNSERFRKLEDMQAERASIVQLGQHVEKTLDIKTLAA